MTESAEELPPSTVLGMMMLVVATPLFVIVMAWDYFGSPSFWLGWVVVVMVLSGSLMVNVGAR